MAFSQDGKPLEGLEQRCDVIKHFHVQWKFGTKDGSRKTRLEAFTVIQARDDDGLNQHDTNGHMNLAKPKERLLSEHPDNILNSIAIFKVKKTHF